MQCGGRLANLCPSCGWQALADARFCMQCGTPLGAAPPPAIAPAAPAVPAGPVQPAVTPLPGGDGGSGALPEERRKVTVLFADLSGYTAVAERMDPELLKGLIEQCLSRLGEEVVRFGGTVDKYIGDNVMALFGAPVAHEDDAERAVRAALGMQEAMGELNASLLQRHGVGFQLRVGVNTGEVLAGAVGETYTVIGDTVNVASRLQAAAAPGGVTVGNRTERVTRHAIEYRALEPLTLKGKADPVPAWEAIGLLAEQPGERAPARAQQTPLIGRDEELRLLDSLFGRMERERRAHLVTVVGQAGVGKTRLLDEFNEVLDGGTREFVFRQGRCLPYGSGVVYWALSEVIRTECGILDSDSSDTAWMKLVGRMRELISPGEGTTAFEASDRDAALIGRSLGIEVPARLAPAMNEDPQRLRERFFSAVRAVIEGMAEQQPVVLAFEDIHWADHGMLDLIEYLAGWVRGPVMLLCLARNELLERRASWGGGRRSATSIFLEPLSSEETKELAASLLPPLPGIEEMIGIVADRAGGNPFFAEEMARRLLDEDSGTTAELPDTVQALLAARLDSLEAFERQLLQQAAVMGRTFYEGVLIELAGSDAAEVRDALMALQEKDLIVPQGSGQLVDEQEFSFKHVLIRDVAYGMLPRTVRSRKHFEVGCLIEARAGDRADELVPLLADHYGRAARLGHEAGIVQEELVEIDARALRFLEAAGDAAASLYSNREALDHYTAARALPSDAEPAVAARLAEKEGDVALRIGRVDQALDAWNDALDYHRGQEDLEKMGDLHRKLGAGLWHKGERKQAIEHYQRGINLLKDGPPRVELVRLYEEAAWLYMHTGDNMLAIYASEKALRLAERLGEAGAASRAHGIFGRVFSRIGDTGKARENLERSVELARGSDPLETVRALLTLGYHLETSEADYEQAGRVYTEGLELARSLGDVPAQVELHAQLAQLAIYRADWTAVTLSTEASAQLAESEGLVGKLCLPQALRGVLAYREGDYEGSERRYRKALALAEQVGWSEVAYSSLLGLGTVLRDRCDYVGAEKALAQALEVCERAGMVAQSIQTISARAVVLALAGRGEEARAAASEAAELAGRMHYPIARAAALEAQGAASEDAAEGARLLEDARAAWEALQRPLDAARCDYLRGTALRRDDQATATHALTAAAASYQRLGVQHLAAQARETLPA